jgi:hypothetical protein
LTARDLLRVARDSSRGAFDVDAAGVDFSAEALFASLVVSVAGMALFRYGRKEQRLPQVFGGLVLMIGPYFSGGALGTWLFAAGVGAFVWGTIRCGL